MSKASLSPAHPLRRPIPFADPAHGTRKGPSFCPISGTDIGRGSAPHRGETLRVRGTTLSHHGSVLRPRHERPFRFFKPSVNEDFPLHVLPIGGLGEIGMNCMLIGHKGRYILLDAGLMFPDIMDLGMDKVLPDTTFLAGWRDKIEAVFITHGHEDHIGALPWVIPSLDPSAPIYAAGFPSRLIENRLKEYNMWDEKRMRRFEMRTPFRCGPFVAEAFRVTHSIPDCCGVALRCDSGTIVHTGDWKIDETPLDGEHYDREFLEQLGNEGVALFMSDSTNALTPGRTGSELTVETSLTEQMLLHQGRIITTQFASNLHRLRGIHKAAEASGRRLSFIGRALNLYLEAAWQEGRAPFDPKTLIRPEDIDQYDPSQLVVVTTGSQGEPRAALSRAAINDSDFLRIQSEDLLLYSAKVIPGNDTKVMTMMGALTGQGARVVMGKEANLHASGHAYRGELEEVLRLVKPQHFLPVHGDAALLTAHAALARDTGVQHTLVARNGQMVGVGELRNRSECSRPSSLAVVGEARLQTLYNDGDRGVGTAREMGLSMRTQLALDGIVIASVEIRAAPGPPPNQDRQQSNGKSRTRGFDKKEFVVEDGNGAAVDDTLPHSDVQLDPESVGLSADENVAEQTTTITESDEMDQVDGAAAAAHQSSPTMHLEANATVTTRAMWEDRGNLSIVLRNAAEKTVSTLPITAPSQHIQSAVKRALHKAAWHFNNKQPEVVVVIHDLRSDASVGDYNSNVPSLGAPPGGHNNNLTKEPIRRAHQQQYRPKQPHRFRPYRGYKWSYPQTNSKAAVQALLSRKRRGGAASSPRSRAATRQALYREFGGDDLNKSNVADQQDPATIGGEQKSSRDEDQKQIADALEQGVPSQEASTAVEEESNGKSSQEHADKKREVPNVSGQRTGKQEEARQEAARGMQDTRNDATHDSTSTRQAVIESPAIQFAAIKPAEAAAPPPSSSLSPSSAPLLQIADDSNAQQVSDVQPKLMNATENSELSSASGSPKRVKKKRPVKANKQTKLVDEVVAVAEQPSVVDKVVMVAEQPSAVDEVAVAEQPSVGDQVPDTKGKKKKKKDVLVLEPGPTLAGRQPLETRVADSPKEPDSQVKGFASAAAEQSFQQTPSSHTYHPAVPSFRPSTRFKSPYVKKKKNYHRTTLRPAFTSLVGGDQAASNDDAATGVEAPSSSGERDQQQAKDRKPFRNYYRRNGHSQVGASGGSDKKAVAQRQKNPDSTSTNGNSATIGQTTPAPPPDSPRWSPTSPRNHGDNNFKPQKNGHYSNNGGYNNVRPRPKWYGPPKSGGRATPAGTTTQAAAPKKYWKKGLQSGKGFGAYRGPKNGLKPQKDEGKDDAQAPVEASARGDEKKDALVQESDPATQPAGGMLSRFAMKMFRAIKDVL